MKKLSFKRILLSSCLICSIFSVQAQEPGKEPVKAYSKLWNSLTPKYAKAQFAGSIGMVSLGVGWDYGKGHWETDALFGLIPRTSDRHAMVTFTLKQNYLPWKIKINEDISFEPLNCGLFFNTLLDGDFWVKEPDRYPKGYYGFSTKVRIHIFVGERFTYKFKRQDQFIKSISAFYEINASDLYLINAFTNSYLKPKDYLSLSFGIKLQVF